MAMRRINGMAALVVGFAVSGALAQDGAAGVWKTEEKDDGRFLHVEIGPCADAAGEVCGTIVAAFGGADPANVGKPIIWDMEPDGAAAWSGGKIWAPDDDETYNSKMSLDDGKLTVSGCVLSGLICRGQDWTRVP